MLIGEYIHSIDNKHRLALPAKFRGAIGEKLILTPGLDSCLFGFSAQEWEMISEKITSNSSILSGNQRDFGRYLFSGAFEVEVDHSGRVLLPESLRRLLGNSSRIAVIGVKNRLEIWSHEVWEDYKAKVQGEISTLSEGLSSLGII